MKILMFTVLSILTLLLVSCEDTEDKETLLSILKKCKGHAVVVAKGYNPGNFEYCRYSLIIRDDSLNLYECVGFKYDVEAGDTLK